MLATLYTYLMTRNDIANAEFAKMNVNPTFRMRCAAINRDDFDSNPAIACDTIRRAHDHYCTPSNCTC